MPENNIERTLGEILATQKGTNKRIDDFRADIKELYGSTGKNSTSVKVAHTRIDDMKEDVVAMKKKSALLGGGSGLGGGALMAFIKDFFIPGGN